MWPHGACSARTANALHEGWVLCMTLFMYEHRKGMHVGGHAGGSLPSVSATKKEICGLPVPVSVWKGCVMHFPTP